MCLKPEINFIQNMLFVICYCDSSVCKHYLNLPVLSEGEEDAPDLCPCQNPISAGTPYWESPEHQEREVFDF